ncbi:hypothetical protein V866_007248 [Kwoniella sp. B9012]
MFTIHCESEVAMEGRSELIHGLQFFRHPDSAFHTVRNTPAQATPTLTHSPRRSTRSTSLNTPPDPVKADSVISSPVHAHHLSHRLSQFQLGSVAGQNTIGGSALYHPTYMEKIRNPELDIDPSGPSDRLAAAPPRLPAMVESVSQISPFQPFELTEFPSSDIPHPSPVLRPPPKSAMQTVKITKYLCPGYLWDFWLGKHSQYGEVVVKLVYLPDYPCNNPEFDDYVPDEQVVKEALKEEDTYLGPLADLQGEVVPRYYGMYHSVPDGEHIAIMLEYIEQPTGGEPRLAEEERKHRLYSAYERLHFRGVLHRDIDFRHILMNKRDMTFRLVSFRRSCRKSLKNEDDVASLMSEYVVVRVSIGWERDEDIANEDIPSCYTSRLADPAAFLAELQAAHEVPLDDWIVEHNRKLSEGISTF